MTIAINKDRTEVALITFCEASNASPTERRMVVHSLFNRLALKPKYGITLAGICFKRYQFSEMNDDAVNNANLERGANTPDNDPVMLDCAAAYDDVYQARVVLGQDDPTKGATHYHDKSIAPPYWADPAKGAVMTLETAKFFFYANVP